MEFLRRRREFIAGLGAAGVWPLVAQAEQITRPRIGVLRPIGSAPHESVEELKAGLQELGYVDGRNIALEIRYADGNFNRLSALATELVRLNAEIQIWQKRWSSRCRQRDGGDGVPVGRLLEDFGKADGQTRPKEARRHWRPLRCRNGCLA